MSRVSRVLSPSHQHSAFSATLLFMATVTLSRVIGYAREVYIAAAFGADRLTDVYYAAFQIPDFLNYILAGSTISSTFISIYTRYLAQHDDERADKMFSVTVSVMALLLMTGIVMAAVFARPLVTAVFPDFKPEQRELCVVLTRILLPAQLFFVLGGVVSGVLQSHRMFLFPALAPIIYNGGIIVGGVFLSRYFGIGSLAVGALAGAIVGPFLINALAATRTNIGFALDLDIGDPGFREWLRKTVPLMLGVSLVTADDWLIRYFASGGQGDITRLNYAKRLFQGPMAILGQAAGAASLPFFARLYNENKLAEFAKSVSDSVYRIAAVSVLISAWMMAASLPIIDIVFRRGRFSFQNSVETAAFFTIFSFSLAFWAAQAIYSRAFYAAGDTLTPMAASTLITIAVVPVYRSMFHATGMTGLAAASDIGILVNTVTFGVLLHRRKLVPVGLLKWAELGKATVTAIVAGTLSYKVGGVVPISGRHVQDLERLGLVTVTWAGAVAAGLFLLRSELPGQLRRKRRLNSAAT
jgi:putative peptidoglycan lipid II flippase